MGRAVKCIYCWLAVLSLASCDQSIIWKRTRVKRSSCHPKFTVIPGHSACLDPSPSVVKAGINSTEKTSILNIHNNYRSGVSPKATDMMKMSWDDDVAFVAQAWAEACIIGQHDDNYKRSIPGRFSVGQNLAWADYGLGFEGSIKLWYDEVKDFNTSGGNEGKPVGHYTQVVWAKSIKLGCGYAQCGSTHNYVCNYAPGGNSDINKPYTFGSVSCSDCPGRCTNNLCDCGGFACENSATMDISACTCQCLSGSHFIGENCALDCDNLSDPNYCTSQWNHTFCTLYSNVPAQCPKMCGTCNYDKPTSGCNQLTFWTSVNSYLLLFLIVNSYLLLFLIV